MRKTLGVLIGAAFMVCLVGAAPASARSDATITVICSGGQIVVSDVNSWTGQTTANGRYNLVNPFGEVCVVYP